jgi:hypothetical protein
MANCVIELVDVDDSVTRRIAMDVVRGFMAKYNIPKNTPVILPNSEDEETLQMTENTEENVKKMFSRIRFKVKVNDTLREEYSAQASMQRHDYRPIFRDTELGIVVSPLYEKRKMSLEIEVISQDNVTAERLRRMIQTTFFRGGANGFLHEAAYHYVIPDSVLVILTQSYRVSRYDQATHAMSKWLYDHLDNQVSKAATIDGKSKNLIKNEAQHLIQGVFSFIGAPDKPTTENQGTKNTVAFTYDFTYERPFALAMDYQQIIHNRFLPAALLPTERKYLYMDKLAIPSRFTHLIYNEPWLRNVDPRDVGVCLPWQIEWYPEFYMPYTESLYRISLIVDECDPRDVVNLTNLGDVNFKELVIDYIKSVGQRVFTHRSAFIHISLHENDKIKGPESLVIDEQLNIRTTFDMDINKRYNVHICAYFFLRHMSDEAKEEIRDNPPLCNLIIGGLDPRLVESGVVPIPDDNGTIPVNDFDKVVDWIDKNATTKFEKRTMLNNFIVGNYVIIARGK